MTDFRMPSLGADMDDGTLVEWLKQPGDQVRSGDIIAVVETQKGAIDIEVFENGILEEIVVEPGTKVPVGDLLARIRQDGKTSRIPHPQAAPSPPTAKAEIAALAKPVASRVPPPHAKITPLARRKAKEFGIAADALTAGPGGIIGIEQVEAIRPAVPSPSKRGVNLKEMRRAIAAAMARSKREIPHYYVTSTIDVSPMTSWLESENTKRSVSERLLYAAPLLKAAALALDETPTLNGHNVDGTFMPSEQVHLGVAVALRGGGLIAPAIHGAEKLKLDDLMAKLRDLVARVRGGRLKSSELTDATVTLSNLGENTADSLTPVIYPPQAAIIGLGQIVNRPWAVGDAVAVRPVITVTVAGDHRVSDGRIAALFLKKFEALLGAPEAL